LQTSESTYLSLSSGNVITSFEYLIGDGGVVPSNTCSSAEDNTVRCLQAFLSSKNITQQLMDASSEKARPGDIIEYTLTAKNPHNAPFNYQLRQEVGDVLEYTDIIDASGGVLANKTNVIVWDEQ